MYIIKYESGHKFAAYDTKEEAQAHLTRLIDSKSEFTKIYKKMYIQFDKNIKGHTNGYMFV